MTTHSPAISQTRLPWLSLSVAACVLLLTTVVIFGWDRSFWYDEVYTLGAAAIGRPVDWAVLNSDVHPPAYNLLVRSLGAFFPGDSPLLRSLNLIGLAALLAGFALLARPLGRDRLALYVCLMLCNGYVLEVGLDLRSYAMLLGFSTLLHALLLRDIATARPQTAALLLVAAVLAALHFFGTAVGLSALFVSAVHHVRTGRRGRAMVLALGIALIAAAVIGYAFGISNLGRALSNGGNWIKLSADPFIDLLVEQSVLVLVLFAMILFRHAPGRPAEVRQTALLTLAVPMIVVAGTFLISLSTPIISTRNLTVCVPGIALAAVIWCPDNALAWIKRTPLLLAVIVVAGLKDARQSVSNFQMIEWAIETATPPACDGAPLYNLDGGNIPRFAQLVFVGEIKRPSINMLSYPKGGTELPEGCDIIAVGWHQLETVDELRRFFEIRGLEVEILLPPDPDLAQNRALTHGFVVRRIDTP